jgi:putative ABC transport system ATP-binding protein
MIAGIVGPDSGRILYDFRGADATTPVPEGSVLNYQGSPPTGPGVTDLAALTEAQRDVFRGAHVGYIFQTHHLLGGFTALENVLLGMSFTGRKADRAWAKRLLADVGLTERADYRPEKLSVGQQQRVAVARALANRPKLVLADEPTGALDPKTAQQVLELIRRLCTEVGASLLLVTHDLDIAHQLPRVVTLSEINRASMASKAAAASAAREGAGIA